jgi:hypothetical protein
MTVPTTFASRRAETDARPSRGQRLVSLGITRMPVDMRTLGGKVTGRALVEVETLYDVDDPMLRYQRMPGGPLQRIKAYAEVPDEVEPLGVVGTDPGPDAFSSFLPTGQSDQVERIA